MWIKKEDYKNLNDKYHEAENDAFKRWCEIEKMRKILEEKDKEIERLKESTKELQSIVGRQNQILTENDLYARRMAKVQPVGDSLLDGVIERLCRLESKIEAKENPYYF